MEKRCRKSPYPYQSSVKKPHSKPRRSSGKWLQLLLFLCFPDPAVNKGSKRIIGICKQKTAKLLKNWDSSSQQPGTLDLLKSACQGFQVLDSCLPIWHSTKSFTGHLYRRFRNLKWHNCHFRSTLIHGAFTKKRTRNLPPHSWFYIGCLLFNVRLPIPELRGKGSSLCLFCPVQVEEWRDSETWEIWKFKAVVICIDS